MLCQLVNYCALMAKSGSDSDNFDEERDIQRFTIQPYQFEPRRDSGEADSNPEDLASDESDDEATNPRLQNLDWYVLVM